MTRSLKFRCIKRSCKICNAPSVEPHHLCHSRPQVHAPELLPCSLPTAISAKTPDSPAESSIQVHLCDFRDTGAGPHCPCCQPSPPVPPQPGNLDRWQL